MSDVYNKITGAFGMIGNWDNESIYYKEGKKCDNFLTYKNIDFSIHIKFAPTPVNTAIKIINHELEK
jgi:hypothetical protein